MKKRVITIGFILLFIFIITFICSTVLFSKYKCNINVINSDFSENKIEVNGSLYCINRNGIHSINEDIENECLLPFNTENSKAFFSSDKSSIYICENDNNRTKITQYDFQGKLISGPAVLELPTENIYAVENEVVYGIISEEDNIKIVTFDMQGIKKDIDLNKYEYTDDVFMFLGDQDRTYYSLITDSSSKYIGRNKNLVIYLKHNYSPELKIIDLDSNNIVNVELGEKFSAYHSFSTIKGNSVCTVMTKTHSTIELGSGHSNNGDISSLKRHEYDIYALIDIDNGTISKQHKTRKCEKIIYADTEKIITYYQGKYITYSTENWKKIDSQKAPEIKKNGSYTFETCGNYVFVFDNNTSEVINKISIT
jgi:hypothetical protein